MSGLQLLTGHQWRQLWKSLLQTKVYLSWVSSRGLTSCRWNPLFPDLRHDWSCSVQRRERLTTGWWFSLYFGNRGSKLCWVDQFRFWPPCMTLGVYTLLYISTCLAFRWMSDYRWHICLTKSTPMAHFDVNSWEVSLQSRTWKHVHAMQRRLTRLLLKRKPILTSSQSTKVQPVNSAEVAQVARCRSGSLLVIICLRKGILVLITLLLIYAFFSKKALTDDKSVQCFLLLMVFDCFFFFRKKRQPTPIPMWLAQGNELMCHLWMWWWNICHDTMLHLSQSRNKNWRPNSCSYRSSRQHYFTVTLSELLFMMLVPFFMCQILHDVCQINQVNESMSQWATEDVSCTTRWLPL